jgi:hypothetical protein
MALVPRNIVPHPQQYAFLQDGQAVTAPDQKLCREATYGLPRGKPQPKLFRRVEVARSSRP